MKKFIKDNGLTLIALHKDMQEELNCLFNVNNTIVVNNGIDFNRFDKSLYFDFKNDIKTNIGFCENDFIVGHIWKI